MSGEAKAIIVSVCERHGVMPIDLQYKKRPARYLSAARGEAIRRLKAADFSIGQIMRLLQISESSICYHLYETRRETVRRCVQRSIERGLGQ
jgi:hypothetical protein